MDQNYFRDKYLINSTRWRGYDYSVNGFYFVTICVKNRECLLGEVRNGIMALNMLGCVVYRYWYKLPEHYFNCVLDEMVVMPNHIHCVIAISVGRDGACPVSTESGKHNTLSNMVGSFKSACTKRIHEMGNRYFSWQPRFYDHIIRIDTESLEKIRHYIKHNPPLWDRDRNNPVNFKAK